MLFKVSLQTDIFHVFKYLRMRNLHEFIKIISKLKNFNEINKLMHLTKMFISDDYCSVFKLSFNISNLALLLIKAMINILKSFIYLFKSFIHLLLYFTKLTCDEITLIEKLLSHSLIVHVKCST